MFNKTGYKERQIETGCSRGLGRRRTSRCELGALAGAAVVVSVLGAELGAGVGEAAGPSGRAAEALGVKAGSGGAKEKFHQRAQPWALPFII